MMKEYKPIYSMGNKMPLAILSKNEKSGLTESKGLASFFSGSDIIGFFGDLKPELMACTINKTGMTCTFAMSDEITPLLLNANYENVMEYYLIGINENGDRCLLRGTCYPIDFSIHTSIDELNVECIVYFNSDLREIKGWMNSTPKSNLEIGLTYKYLVNKWRKKDAERAM